jgi:hypothetical protein
MFLKLEPDTSLIQVPLCLPVLLRREGVETCVKEHYPLPSNAPAGMRGARL